MDIENIFKQREFGLKEKPKFKNPLKIRECFEKLKKDSYFNYTFSENQLMILNFLFDHIEGSFKSGDILKISKDLIKEVRQMMALIIILIDQFEIYMIVFSPNLKSELKIWNTILITNVLEYYHRISPEKFFEDAHDGIMDIQDIHYEKAGQYLFFNVDSPFVKEYGTAHHCDGHVFGFSLI